MKQTFLEIFSYLKNPVLEKDTNENFKYRLKKFGHLLLISLLTGFLISPIFVIIEEFGLINMEDHSIGEMLENFPKLVIFFFVVIIGPSIEELIFRGPLTLFKSKKPFKIVFYTLTILFGLIHISNFTMTKNVLLLTPILVLPQILLGGYLGFIRVRFDLGWSIALHACYNGVLMLITFSTDLH